jgi:hypothetical protein
MISARSVFLYLCVSLAALAASALSASAATSSSPSPFSTKPFFSSSGFLSCHPFNFAGRPAGAVSVMPADACAAWILRVSPVSRRANTGHQFQNTQENAGSTAINVCSGERNDKRGTGSL